MADYAELITALKAELDAEDAAVIGFGGSYGALLACLHSVVLCGTRGQAVAVEMV